MSDPDDHVKHSFELDRESVMQGEGAFVGMIAA
jgi:hypothetical protein